MKDRIKKLRKTLGLTQQKFADEIGTAQNNIAGYETGKRSPSEAVISLICKTFNVDERWLRTGEGEMFRQKSRDDEITAFVDDILHDDTDFRQKFISVLARMTAEEWKLLEKKVLELSDEVKSSPTIDQQADEVASATASAAREEFILEKKAEEGSSVSLSDTGRADAEQMA